MTNFSFINTPLQRGESGSAEFENRFSGFDLVQKTAEAVAGACDSRTTPLKQGVNERDSFGTAKLVDTQTKE